MHSPMFLLVNLAVGGSWPGSPDATTGFPANMQIDYVRAYASGPEENIINGGASNDTFNFNFNLADATVSFSGNQVIVDGPSGSHTVLTGVETFVFTDGTVNDNDGDPLVNDLFYYSHNHDVWNAHVDADQHYHESWLARRTRSKRVLFDLVLSLAQSGREEGGC